MSNKSILSECITSLKQLIHQDREHREEITGLNSKEIRGYNRSILMIDEFAADVIKKAVERSLVELLNNSIRPDVMRFAIAMESKLKENDHKSGYSECSHNYLINRLNEEAGELFDAVTPEQKRDESIDVANFAMMIYSNQSSKPEVD